MGDKKDQLPQIVLFKQNSFDSPPMSKKRKGSQTKKGTQIRDKGLDSDLKSEIVESAVPGERRSNEPRSPVDGDFPRFVKTMVPSNCTSGSWLHLPKPFCRQHLPWEDAVIYLEDENGEEYKTTYIVEKTGLSGGWKAFAGVHKLLQGDVLDFHLVGPSKFKVYIKRANELPECPRKLIYTTRRTAGIMEKRKKDSNKNSKTQIKAKRLKLLPPDSSQQGNQSNDNMVLADDSENGSKDYGSDDSEDIRFSGLVLDFKEVKSIENFVVLINNFPIDSELSHYNRTKYYELCCSQKSFLHDNLLKSINGKLAAEIISSTINIADAIRASKHSTMRADFATWDKTLEGFELLGMNVRFLRNWVNRLMTLASGSERYKEAKLKRARVEEEIRTLNSRILELKQTTKRLDSEMEAIKITAERSELIFEEEVNAPWILEQEI